MTDLFFGTVTVLIIAAICHAQAFLTRPELFFAVTVAADFRKSTAARHILDRYVISGWLGAAVCLILMTVARVSVPTMTLLAAGVWVAAFLVGRRAATPFASKPTSMREVSLEADDQEHRRAALALAWGPAAIIAAKAAFVFLHWGEVADRIPVHWGWNGADRWVTRSPVAVGGLLAAIGSMALLIALSGYATLFRSRAISASGPGAPPERSNRRIGFFGLLAMAYVMAVTLPPIEGVLPAVPFTPAIIAATTGGMVIALLRSGQGGTRTIGQQVSNSPPLGDRTADNCWKLGLFYYNPDDPSFLVEKRFGIGWTWNFGNRWSWVVIPVVLLTMFLPLLFR